MESTLSYLGIINETYLKFVFLYFLLFFVIMKYYPGKSKDLLIKIPVLIILTKFSISILVPFLRHRAGDDVKYAETAYNIISCFRFGPRFTRHMALPIGAPLLYAPAFFFKHPFFQMKMMQFMNILISMACFFPVFHVLRRYMRKSTALAGAVLLQFLPSLMAWTYYPLSESGCTSMLVLTFCCLHGALRTDKKKYWLYGGLFLGFSILFRPIALVILIAFGGMFALDFISDFKRWKEKLKSIGFFAVGYLLGLTPKLLVKMTYLVTATHGSNAKRLDIMRFMFGADQIHRFMEIFMHHISDVVILSGGLFIILLIALVMDGKAFFQKKERPLFLFYLTIFSSIIGFTLLVVQHGFGYRYVEKAGYYIQPDILVRYMDPVIPLAFLAGFIAFFRKKKIPAFAILSGLILYTVALFMQQYDAIQFRNSESIGFIVLLFQHVSFYSIVRVLAASFALIACAVYVLRSKWKKRVLIPLMGGVFLLMNLGNFLTLANDQWLLISSPELAHYLEENLSDYAEYTVYIDEKNTMTKFFTSQVLMRLSCKYSVKTLNEMQQNNDGNALFISQKEMKNKKLLTTISKHRVYANE